MTESNVRLTFADLRTANEARQAHWGGTDNWTLADWSNAVAGEVGEACNIVKKIRRPELGTTGNSEDVSALYPKLESEIGDVLIYLDLLAKKAGTTLDRCVSRAFNEKSEALGMPVRLEALALRTPSDGEVVAEPAAWEGYWPGAGSISSQTSLTRFRSTMEKWEKDGAEITPLYTRPQGMEVTDEMASDVASRLFERRWGEGTGLTRSALTAEVKAALTDALTTERK